MSDGLPEGHSRFVPRCPECKMPPGGGIVMVFAMFGGDTDGGWTCDECGADFEEPVLLEVDPLEGTDD